MISKILYSLGPAGGGSATDVHLQLSSIVNPQTYCGDSPYELSNLNLLNLTATFTATTSGIVSVANFIVKDTTTGVPNVLNAVYLSATVYAIGDVLNLNAIIAPPGGGVSLRAYYHEYMFAMTSKPRIMN